MPVPEAERHAAIFIDGGYLDKTLRNEHHGAMVDFDRLATEMAGGLPRYRAYYYHCPRWMPDAPSEDDKRAQQQQDRFFDRVRRLPRFEVRLGHLKTRGRDATGSLIFQQKGVDVLLAIDMVLVAAHRSASVVSLLAGDGDYLPLVKVVKDAGPIVRLYHAQATTPQTHYAQELWTAADERFPIDQALVDRIRR